MADKEKRQYGARIGNDYWSDNGVEIELGSGPRAFGGAKSWPCLRIQIGFPVGDEGRMAKVASIITQVLIREGVIQSLGEAVFDV